jgi:hypothetical protein
MPGSKEAKNEIMNQFNRDEFKLQGLLCRFVDERILTSENVSRSHDYLFFNKEPIPEVDVQDLYETLVYLKDLMKVNLLSSIDDILFYFETQRSSLRVFMQHVMESDPLPEVVNKMQELPVESGFNFEFVSHDQPKCLPPSCICVRSLAPVIGALDITPIALPYFAYTIFACGCSNSRTAEELPEKLAERAPMVSRKAEEWAY